MLGKEPALAKIEEITSLVAQHGCPNWAKDLAENEPNESGDELIPPNWKELLGLGKRQSAVIAPTVQ